MRGFERGMLENVVIYYKFVVCVVNFLVRVVSFGVFGVGVGIWFVLRRGSGDSKGS